MQEKLQNEFDKKAKAPQKSSERSVSKEPTVGGNKSVFNKKKNKEADFNAEFADPLNLTDKEIANQSNIV